MKKIKQLSFVLFSIMLFSACDKAEDLLDQDLSFSFDEEFTVSNQNGGFAESITFSAREDGNIDDNFDNIKGYEVSEIGITLSNIQVEAGNATKLSGLTMTISGSGTPIALSVSDDIDLAAANGGSIQVNIQVEQAALDNLRDKIASGDQVTVAMTATINDGPASFDGVLIIKGKVTVGL